jgi:hypothetical protein
MKAVAAFQDAQAKGRAIVLITDEVRESHIDCDTTLKGKCLTPILIVCLQENAETIAELISRNKPVIVTDVEPLAPGQ